MFSICLLDNKAQLSEQKETITQWVKRDLVNGHIKELSSFKCRHI